MLDEFREDLDKQKNGSPIYLGDYTFWVRRWGTPDAIKERKELSQKLFGPLHKYEPEDDHLLLAHWLAEFGVTGWEGVKDDDGKEVKHSKKRAREIFLDEQYWLSLNDQLFREANRFENYLHDEREASTEETKKP